MGNGPLLLTSWQHTQNQIRQPLSGFTRTGDYTSLPSPLPTGARTGPHSQEGPCKMGRARGRNKKAPSRKVAHFLKWFLHGLVELAGTPRTPGRPRGPARPPKSTSSGWPANPEKKENVPTERGGYWRGGSPRTSRALVRAPCALGRAQPEIYRMMAPQGRFVYAYVCQSPKPKVGLLEGRV